MTLSAGAWLAGVPSGALSVTVSLPALILKFVWRRARRAPSASQKQRSELVALT